MDTHWRARLIFAQLAVCLIARISLAPARAVRARPLECVRGSLKVIDRSQLRARSCDPTELASSDWSLINHQPGNPQKVVKRLDLR